MATSNLNSDDTRKHPEPGSNKGNHPDLFTVLWLKLSEAHKNQTQKLEDRIETLEKKCGKIAAIANNNAACAKEYRFKCKTLQEECDRLQERLTQTERQRTESKEDGTEAENDQAIAVLEDRDVNSELQSQYQVRSTSKSNRLTKVKNKKKVRYSEVTPAETLRQDTCGDATQDAIRNCKDGVAISASQHLSKKKETTSQGYREIARDVQRATRDSDNQHRLTDEIRSDINRSDREEAARILVPETCQPLDEMESSFDNGDVDEDARDMGSSIGGKGGGLYGGGDSSQTRKAQRMAVPETLAPVDFTHEDHGEVDFSEQTHFDPPTFSSTPVQIDLSQRIREQLGDITDYQQSPTFSNETRRHCKSKNENKSARRNKVKTNQSRSELQQALEVDDNDETRCFNDEEGRSMSRNSKLPNRQDRSGTGSSSQVFAENDDDDTVYVIESKNLKKGRTSLPKSESQFPVDFSISRPPSPTFHGGENDKEMDGTGLAGVSVKHDFTTTPVRDSNQESHWRHKTPHSILGTDKTPQSMLGIRTPQSMLGSDESYQSEASLYLLQAPLGPPTPKHQQAYQDIEPDEIQPIEEPLPSTKTQQTYNNIEPEEIPPREEPPPTAKSKWKANPRKRKFSDEIDNDEDYKDEMKVTGPSGNPYTDGSHDDETFMDASLKDKENSPPVPSQETSVVLPGDLGDGMEESDRPKARSGNKTLKQSKLTPAMFRSSPKTHNTSLLERYNGVGKVNLDSQRDESLAKAIEMSILSSIDSFKNKSDEDVAGDHQHHQDDFKVPLLPHFPHKIRSPGKKDKERRRMSDVAGSSYKRQDTSNERTGRDAAGSASTVHGFELSGENRHKVSSDKYPIGSSHKGSRRVDLKEQRMDATGGSEAGNEQNRSARYQKPTLEATTVEGQESDDIVFDMIDARNVGASRLSRKKRRTARETSSTAVRADERKVVLEVPIEKVEVEEVIEEEGDNSCVDMFGDEAEEHADTGDGDDKQRRMSSHGSKRDEVVDELPLNQSIGTRQIAQEFDRLPSKAEVPSYKYVDVVRKKEERQRLNAYDCKQCEAFYKDMNLTEAEKRERMKTCSRHRGHFSPPSTPEHYWEVDFPDTQTCLQRGYLNFAEPTDQPPRKRSSHKYKQLFSAR